MTFSFNCKHLIISFLLACLAPEALAAEGELPIISATKLHLALKNYQPTAALPAPENCDDQQACQINKLLTATKLQNNEVWADAATLYGELSATIPVLEDYLLLKQAECALKAGFYEAASSATRRLYNEYPESRFALNHPELDGDIAYAAATYDLAEELYRTTLETLKFSHAQYAHLRLQLAYTLLKLNKLAEAAQEFQYVKHHWPSQIYAQQAETELARLKEQNIVPPVPGTAAKKNYAKALKKAGMSSQAAAIYETLIKKAKAKSPEQLELIPLFLDALLRANKYDSAASWMAKLPMDQLSKQPERWQLELRLANGQKDIKRQQFICQTLAKNYPNDKITRNVIQSQAFEARDNGNFKLSLQLFSKLFAGNRTDVLAQNGLWQSVLINIRLQKYPEALKQLDILSRIYKRDTNGQARIQYWRGRILSWQNNTAEAQAAFRKVFAEQPLGYYAMLAAMYLEDNSTVPVKAYPVTEVDGNSEWLPTITTENSLQLCGHGIRATKLPPPGYLPSGEQPPAIQRALLFATIGLSKEVFNELATIGSNGQQPENIQTALAFGDYYHAYNWSRKALGISAVQLPTTENSELFHSYFPLVYPEIIADVAQEAQIYDLLLMALMRQESLYQPSAHSFANARGLMQIIPITGKRIAARLGDNDFNENRLFEEPLSIKYSAWYIQQLLIKFHQQLPLAIGSYNAGPKAMSRWIKARSEMDMDLFVELVPYQETRNYIKRVLGGLHSYCTIYEPGSVIPWPAKADSKYLDNVNF